MPVEKHFIRMICAKRDHKLVLQILNLINIVLILFMFKRNVIYGTHHRTRTVKRHVVQSVKNIQIVFITKTC